MREGENRPAEEARLDFLLGEWNSSDRTYPGPHGSGGASEGAASYSWRVGGKWLLYDFRTNLPGLGLYEVHGGVTYEPGSGKYRAYAVNSQGNVLLYRGAWEGDGTLVFTLIHPERQEDHRITYTKLSDGTVRMTSERPTEGGFREVYFETILSR
jgi:hypothetical protein